MFRRLLFAKQKTKNIILKSPEEQYSERFSNLLDQYASYHEETNTYVQALVDAFFSRKINVQDNTIDDSFFLLKQQLEAELQGENALLASKAIAQKLASLLKKESIAPSLPRMIVSVYNHINDKNVLSLDCMQIHYHGRARHLSLSELENFYKIAKLFNIESLRFGDIFTDLRWSVDSLEWKMFLAFLSDMKRIDLACGGLNSLSKEHLISLANALPTLEVLNIAKNFNSKRVVDTNKELKLKYQESWETLVKVVLSHPNLIVLALDDFDALLALYASEKQLAFHQQLSSSTIRSLQLIPISFHPNVNQDQVTDIIANNNRCYALSLEHGGLKQLITYSIWNHPATTKLYAANKHKLSTELRQDVDSKFYFGTHFCLHSLRKLKKIASDAPPDEAHEIIMRM